MDSLVEATKGGAERWESFPLQLPGTPALGTPTACYVRPATAAKALAAKLSTTVPSGCTQDDNAFELAVRIYTSSTTPLSVDSFVGAGAIFSPALWLDAVGWQMADSWSVYEPPASSARSFVWALRAYGVTKPVAGETFGGIVGPDNRTAASALADERFTVVSLMVKDSGLMTDVAIASGRVFDSVQTALGCVVLNGHKIGHHAAFSSALGAPPGPFIAPFVAIYSGAPLGTWANEVKVLTMSQHSLHERLDRLVDGDRAQVLANLRQLGITASWRAHEYWLIAASTRALKIVIQLARGMSLMSALSVAAGKHAVVNQDGKLSTPFVAFYSLFNPRAVGKVMADADEAAAMAMLAGFMDDASVGYLPIEEAAQHLSEASGMAWHDVLKESEAASGGTDFSFAKSLAANLKDAKGAMSGAALARAQNQALRSAIQANSHSLATESWQLIHCTNVWTDIAVHAPISPTMHYPTTPVVLEAASEELSGLFTTRFDGLVVGPESAWAGALSNIIGGLNRAEFIAIPMEATPDVTAFLKDVSTFGIAFASNRVPLTQVSEAAMTARQRWQRSVNLKRMASTLLAYFRDLAEEQETTVTFAPSLISY